MAKLNTQQPAPAQAAKPAAPAAPPAAPAAPPANAAPTNSALTVVYAAGKAYNVRPGTAQDNSRSWQAIQACLQANGGTATRAQLHAAVSQYNHVPFVGYCIRRAWLVPQAATPAPQAQPAPAGK